MKKQIAIVVVGVVALVVGYAAHSFTLAGCQKPSGNSKACYDPDNKVGTCEEQTYFECNTARDIWLYEINQFPDGTEDADEGRTKTESTECWRRHGCIWKGTEQDGHCEQSGSWSSWRLKEKTVKKDDNEIDADDDCKPGE